MCDILNSIKEISAALLTPVLAVVGTWILVNQYRLERLRWKLSLYGKRYPVFLSTMEFIANIVRAHDVSNESLMQFIRNSKDREFLFGDDVKHFMDDLYKKGVDLSLAEKILNSDEPVGEKRNGMAKQSSQLVDWFAKQFDVSKKLFGKYLRVEAE